MNTITLGFSVHRPEMIPIAEKIMTQHEVIFLEEPPDTRFKQMLEGRLGVEDYMMPMDLEYPEFSRAMCHLERKLYKMGKQLIQTDPFIEALLLIHDGFADGRRPGDLDKKSMSYYVYAAERDATGALLQYYTISVAGTFAETIAAVRQFARADAARLRLRDSLRAQEIARHIKHSRCIFIEAGMIHISLFLKIWKQFGARFEVRPLYMDRMALTEKQSHQCTYSPGDLLTLAYVFHPGFLNDKWESLLAARSLVYSKIVQKQENTDNADGFSHLKNERECIGMVRRLTMGDCQYLYPVIRYKKTSESFRIVQAYLDRQNNP